MGLGKIVVKLGDALISKAPVLGTKIHNSGRRLQIMEVFNKEYLKQNKKQLIGTFGAGFASAIALKMCSSEPKAEVQPPKKQKTEYKVCVWADDTLKFKSKENAENFTRLYKEYKKSAGEREALYFNGYSDALDSKAYKDYRNSEEAINAEYDKNKKPIVAARDKEYHTIDSIRDANRAKVDAKFKKQMAPLDSIKTAKIDKNEKKFNSTPEGRDYNRYWEVDRENTLDLLNKYQVLKDVFKANK